MHSPQASEVTRTQPCGFWGATGPASWCCWRAPGQPLDQNRMFVALSRFTIANEKADEVRSALLQRPHLVDTAQGLLGMDVMSPIDNSAEIWLVARWCDEQSYHTWHRSHQYHESWGHSQRTQAGAGDGHCAAFPGIRDLAQHYEDCHGCRIDNAGAGGAAEISVVAGRRSVRRDGMALRGAGSAYDELAGHQREALSIVNDCIDVGHDLVEVEQHVIKPFLYHIEEEWQANQVTVVAEHLATAIAQLVMTVGLLRSTPPTMIGRRVLLACVAGNLHCLGQRYVRTRGRGWGADGLR